MLYTYLIWYTLFYFTAALKCSSDRHCEDANRLQPAQVSGVEPWYLIAPERVKFFIFLLCFVGRKEIDDNKFFHQYSVIFLADPP